MMSIRSTSSSCRSWPSPVCNRETHADCPVPSLRGQPSLTAPKGYNFKSLQDIAPFLEPSGSGISSLWARTTALKYNCTVCVGYPEKVDVAEKWPTSPEYYNSLIMVNGEGETVANYRKQFLYATDETWALEGGGGFYDGFIPGFGRTSMGICKLHRLTSAARAAPLIANILLFTNRLNSRHGSQVSKTRAGERPPTGYGLC